MDPRLIPVNGLLALLRGEGGWPRVLGEAGFVRFQLEMPISTEKGEVVADAVIYRQSPDVILPCECKSGRDVKEKQAEKYLSLDESWLRRSGAIPPPLQGSSALAVHPLYVGTEENRGALEQGLQAHGAVPLLTVGAGRAQLTGAGLIPGLGDFTRKHDAGLPPARLPVDHQSDDGEILELLIPVIVAAQASLRDIVSVDRICEDILPEWPILGMKARREFVVRIAQLLSALASREWKGQFRYDPPAGKQPHLPGRLVILDSPATRHPQGRTQAFQAQQRRSENVLRGKSRPARNPGQTSLDELAQEGGLADE